MRRGVRGFGSSLITSTSTTFGADGSDGLQVIGNVFENPDLAAELGIDPEDLDEFSDLDEEIDDEEELDALEFPTPRGYTPLPHAMRNRPRGQSRAAAGRMRGDPAYFISSPAGGGVSGVSSGALFVDTDGRRVQHGDDF